MFMDFQEYVALEMDIDVKFLFLYHQCQILILEEVWFDSAEEEIQFIDLMKRNIQTPDLETSCDEMYI